MQRLTGPIAVLPRRRRGFVLIIVMVLVAMVAFAGFAFVNSMSDEYRAVDTNGDQLAAEQALASAELLVLKTLEAGDSSSLDNRRPAAEDEAGADFLSDNAELFQDVPLLPPEGGRELETDAQAWRFSVVSRDRKAAGESAESDNIRFGVENESARLNLATLMELDAADPEQSRSTLMSFPGMTESTADALLDWLDSDSEPRQFGAEVEDYLDQPNSLQPRNGLPLTFEELLLVRGVSRRLLFGADENRNFVIDRHESPPPDQFSAVSVPGAGDETDVQGLGWADLLTLHSAERNVNSRGEPRIDLNQPDAARLRAELSAALPKEVVDFILLCRSYGLSGSGPSATGSAASAAGGALPFRLTSVGDLIDASVAVPDGSSARTVPSPITSTSRELLDVLLDGTTTDGRTVIPGRININLASRPVLRGIPGVELEIIERLVARRGTLEDTQRRTPAWLLSEQMLSVEQFRALLPFVTTGGDVYRGQLIAWRPAGGMTRRAEVIFDATSRPARRLAWTDLSALGTGIPIARLSSFAGNEQSPGSAGFR